MFMRFNFLQARRCAGGMLPGITGALRIKGPCAGACAGASTLYGEHACLASWGWSNARGNVAGGALHVADSGDPARARVDGGKREPDKVLALSFGFGLDTVASVIASTENLTGDREGVRAGIGAHTSPRLVSKGDIIVGIDCTTWEGTSGVSGPSSHS